MNKISKLLIMAMFVAGCVQNVQPTTEMENVEVATKESRVVLSETTEKNPSDYEEIYIYKSPYKEKEEAEKKDSTKPSFSLETSMRCVVDVKNKDVITTIPFKHEAFDLARLNPGDALPMYEVTGYTFENKPANVVFEDLLKEADIKVVGTDKYYPEISADKITGELTDIMDSISDAADVYYTYNEDRRTVYLRRFEQLVFTVPNRELILPALDALQGGGIEDISVDWVDNTLIFESDKLQERRALRLIELFDEEPQLAMFDVTVYHVEPVNKDEKVDWTALINTYGTDNIKSGEQGTIGKVLVTSHVVNQKTLINLLSAQAKVYQVAQGEFSVPNKWRSRFDIWNCGNIDISENRMAILAQSEIKDKRILSKIGIDTLKGEVSSFDATNRLDENIVLFGIPSESLGYSETGETIVLMTPRIVDVIKEN